MLPPILHDFVHKSKSMVVKAPLPKVGTSPSKVLKWSQTSKIVSKPGL